MNVSIRMIKHINILIFFIKFESTKRFACLSKAGHKSFRNECGSISTIFTLIRTVVIRLSQNPRLIEKEIFPPKK
jgi:hypothetical protein